MTILSWRYQHGEWAEYARRRIGPVTPGGFAYALLAMVIACLLSVVLIAWLQSVAMTLLAVAVAINVVFSLIDRTWQARLARLENEMPGREVVITSTGISFGDRARLWHGEGERLSDAWVENDPWPVLVLVFARRLRREHLHVPLPLAFRDDAVEVAEMLAARTRRPPAAVIERAPRPRDSTTADLART